MTLVYHRPFEKDTPPLKVFTVNVTVGGTPASNMAQPTLAPTSMETPTTVVNPPNGWKGWQVYTNLEYGFSFQYPPEWRLEEVQGDDKTLSGHAVQLFPNNHPDALMQVAFKHASEDMPLGQTGLGNGELITWGKVLFLGSAREWGERIVLGEPVQTSSLVLEESCRLAALNREAADGGLVRKHQPFVAPSQ